MNPPFHLVSRRVLFGLAALSAVLVFTSQVSAADPGKIVVQVDKSGAKISPTFYGLMTEEINYSYDGGLYGELIQNRIFKNTSRGGPGGFGRGPVKPPGPPAPLPPEVAMARPTVDEVAKMNADLKQFMETSPDKDLL